MKLIKPEHKYYRSYLDAIKEDELYSPLTERIFSSDENYFDRVKNYELGINLPVGYVKSTQLWLIDNEEFIGEVGIRHQLTPTLLNLGGTIGYEVRYSRRKQGYGSKMLALTLQYIKDHLPYIKKVLITCNDDNIGSYRVMEKNGAILGEKVLAIEDGKEILIRKYWINLTPMIIETERLILRETNINDFDDLFAILSDPETMKHYPAPYDKAKVERWINWCLKSYQKYGFGLWAVTLKNSGKYIGDCGLSMQMIEGEQLPEIGYHLNKGYWNRGYATEAARAVKDYIFKNYSFDALYTYTSKTNVPSIKVALKNGMRHFKDYVDDRNEITKVYVITKEEHINNKG